METIALVSRGEWATGASRMSLTQGNFSKIRKHTFAHTFTGDIDLEVSFYEGSLSGFGVRVVLTLKNEFGSIPSYTSFWKSLRRIGVNSSLNIW